MAQDKHWCELHKIEEVSSPSLLIYPNRIRENAQTMIAMAGGTERLRPHIKTHKMAEIIRLQINLGIDKFKCATIAEAELLAKCKAKDILLAMQPVSNQINSFFTLIKEYPDSHFSTLVDNAVSINEITEISQKSGIRVDLWLDINNGMNRTGIIPGKEARELYKILSTSPMVNLRGLHVYDGHIHIADPELRKDKCDRDFASVLTMKTELEEDGYALETIVAGGTPTFPIHKKRKHVELSPGTPLLWDEGYGSSYADLLFLPAAVLLTRIISKPNKDLLCFDLGHKSVASEMNLPRLKFLGNHQFEQIGQSEEHLVVKCADADAYNIGQAFYVIPMHICPTVSKYPRALCVENNEITGFWTIAARDH